MPINSAETTVYQPGAAGWRPAPITRSIGGELRVTAIKQTVAIVWNRVRRAWPACSFGAGSGHADDHRADAHRELQ